ncbi:hypothetical protein KIW84_033110 [Lathyrus oleraceus]|uniref:Uncharacterized protein n=1 Tax=Pisum sativum TaxID=3888 RepID=A0A9D4XX58_PEA|nr:hypothetical protein KIW84_033110 [Pisum sativum]
MEKLEQNQAPLKEDMDSVKENMEEIKDKMDQLTRAITNMLERETETYKRNVASMSTPPPGDGNPLQGFTSDIQGGKIKNGTPHIVGFILTLVHNGAYRLVQIPIPQDNYVVLSQQYEEEDPREGPNVKVNPMSRHGGPTINLVEDDTIVNQMVDQVKTHISKIHEKMISYKALEELHANWKICLVNPDICGRMKEFLQQMMNEGLVQFGYTRKIEDVSFIESHGRTPFDIPYQQMEAPAPFQISFPTSS